MFSTVSIKNFQSHKDTKIQFENGVNVLVGSSDQGKSAILRAVLWAVHNRPLGTDAIVSHWARDEKNKIADTMSVKITTENGTVIRKRTADSNEYILKTNDEKKEFTAVNKDVPQDVIDFFRLTDVNIQQQHDAPFLLAQSPSDVAKYFNKIVRLDIIDKVLGNAESTRRDTNKKIKEYEQEKKSFERRLEDYHWIETAQTLAEKLDNTANRIKSYVNEHDELKREIEQYADMAEILKDFPDFKAAAAFVEKIEKIQIDYDGLNELVNDIEKHKTLDS
jgi:DNA repair exonuclease SbcCD ATPase subunit